MKRKVALSLFILGSFVLFWAGTQSFDGRLGYTGSPGEQTCSATGCHGIGNVGGLANNAGPGSVSITASPAFTNGQYLPNQTYAVTVTVSEANKSFFGFSFEALDNSGGTNPKTNNSVGTITITDANTTKKGQYFNTGRVEVVQSDASVASTNVGSQTFTFNWTAPASGTVNLYAVGNATNGNGQADKFDNIYTTNMQLTPNLNTSVTESISNNFALSVFPNPAKENASIMYELSDDSNVEINLLNIEGKLVDVILKSNQAAGKYSSSIDLGSYDAGLYFIQLKTNEGSVLKKVAIQ